MARLNIDDSFWIDPRLKHLTKKLKCEFKAIGQCVALWRIAQEFYKKDEPFTLRAFEFSSLSKALIESDFARCNNGIIEVSGSKEYFRWLRDRIESASSGGKKNAIRMSNEIIDVIEANVHFREANDVFAKQTDISAKPLTLPLIKKEEEIVQSVANAPDPLAALWNQNRGKLSGILSCKGNRLKHAKARWKENPSECFWLEVIKKICDSSFCNGENDRGWKADFDFLIKPDTATKVLEGKYSGRQSKKQAPQSPFVEEIKRKMELENKSRE